LLADFHVLVDIDFDDVFGRDLAKRRQYGLDKKFAGARYSRADMAVIIGQTLVKHDAVA